MLRYLHHAHEEKDWRRSTSEHGIVLRHRRALQYHYSSSGIRGVSLYRGGAIQASSDWTDMGDYFSMQPDQAVQTFAYRGGTDQFHCIASRRLLLGVLNAAYFAACGHCWTQSNNPFVHGWSDHSEFSIVQRRLLGGRWCGIPFVPLRKSRKQAKRTVFLITSPFRKHAARHLAVIIGTSLALY